MLYTLQVLYYIKLQLKNLLQINRNIWFVHIHISMYINIVKSVIFAGLHIYMEKLDQSLKF